MRGDARAGLKAGLNVRTLGVAPLGFLALLLPVVAVFAFFHGDVSSGLLALGVALGAGALWVARRKMNAGTSPSNE